MLIGGGLKNKVLEAFAMQRAVVSNTLGMEAIDATPGEHYVAAETPAEFAARIQELLDDTTRAHVIGRAAREYLLERYTWRVVGQQMNALICDVLA
jgi:glycosyltransferase involved in cell wall biosynthesis